MVKMAKVGNFCPFLLKKHLNATFYIEKNWFWEKKFFAIFGPPRPPPGVPHFSALGAHIQNRLGRSSNLAYWGVHAKFQPIRIIQLARAMGRVRFLTSHLVIGGHIHTYITAITSYQLSKTQYANQVDISSYLTQRG